MPGKVRAAVFVVVWIFNLQHSSASSCDGRMPKELHTNSGKNFTGGLSEEDFEALFHFEDRKCGESLVSAPKKGFSEFSDREEADLASKQNTANRNYSKAKRSRGKIENRAAAKLGKQKTTPQTIVNEKPKQCKKRRLKFSADYLPSVPSAGTNTIWGGNATGGGSRLYSNSFLSRVRKAKSNGHQTFAYLEGPCGDTGGVDDGERSRCSRIHKSFNRKNAPGTSTSARLRWKPYTFKQLKYSGKHGIDHCEIDNLSNNVNIPLIPFLREYKTLYDKGQIHCKIVLKNLEVSTINRIKAKFKGKGGATFISPFHIYEARSTSKRRALNAAMVRLKGKGAVTLISTNTNRYGDSFTKAPILTCDKGPGVATPVNDLQAGRRKRRMRGGVF